MPRYQPHQTQIGGGAGAALNRMSAAMAAGANPRPISTVDTRSGYFIMLSPWHRAVLRLAPNVVTDMMRP
jgi:hypothetical protein